MKKFLALSIVFAMMIALCVSTNAVVHNPEDTTVFWRDDKTNVKHSFDTVYIDGVSQMDLGWGGDGGAHKMITNHPLTVGDNVTSTIALRGWAGMNNETYPGVTISEFGYYLNEDESTYVQSGVANAAEQPVVDAGGEFRFENLSIDVSGLTDPTLITIVVKGTDGNLYPFGEFSINGAYTAAETEPEETQPEETGEKDPDQWLCVPEAEGLGTGWWFNPCGTPEEEPDPANPRYAAFTFTAEGAFSGIVGFYWCGDPKDEGVIASTMKVELIKDDEVVADGLVSVIGNNWGETDFGQPFPAGEYTLRYTCYSGNNVANTSWNVIGSANVGDTAVTIDDNVGGPQDKAPAIMLVGAVPPATEPGEPDIPEETRELETIEEGKLNIVIDGGVERKEAKAGDEVEVKIQLKNNTKIASILTKLTWNEKLSLVSSKVDINDLVPAGGSSNALVVTKEEDPTTCNINWAYNNGQITEAECTYATLVFKVADNAAAGEFLEINAEIDPDNVFDEDMENVDFKLINGGIDVIGEEETQPEETQPEETGEATQPEETQGETNPNNPNTADIAIIAVASVAAVALAGAVIGKKALKK
ncbi:MAG: hypothetical protein J5879_07750 [Clostridia bacterium]|nr:hypothetical protein [Clostridia bacterium]